MNKYYKINIAALFLTAVLVVLFMGICPRSSGRSGTETRILTEFPEFSFEAFFNGEYTATITEWFSDTVPYRDTMLDLASTIRGLYGIDYIVKTEDGKEIHFESNGVQEGIKDERPDGNVSDPLAAEGEFSADNNSQPSEDVFADDTPDTPPSDLFDE